MFTWSCKDTTGRAIGRSSTGRAHTRREIVSFAVRQLVNAGAPVSGIVLSRVNVKKHARYGYGDSGYYHGDNKLYYAR
jgi:hypothetical protein